MHSNTKYVFINHLNNCFHVFFDELLLDHLHDALFSAVIKIILGPVSLFLYAALHPLDVNTRAVFCQEFLTLQLKQRAIYRDSCNRYFTWKAESYYKNKNQGCYKHKHRDISIYS